MTAHVTISTSSEPSKYFKDSKHFTSLQDLKTEQILNKTKVFLNGTWIGITENSMDVYDELRKLKRNAVINIFTSVSFNYELNELIIQTDSGRCCRPLYIVDNNKLRIKKSDIEKIKNKEYNWNNLILKSINTNSIYSQNKKEQGEGVIEYLDKEETYNSLIAMNPTDLKKDIKYTHCEIHPSLILGILASSIPFSNHNQSLKIHIKVLWVNRQWESTLRIIGRD